MQKLQAGERSDPYAHNAQGVQHALGGRLAEAVTCFRAAVALKPDFAEGRNNLALVLKEQGSLDEAVIVYAEALALRPDFPEAHYNLALALLKRGDLSAGWPEHE